MQSVPSSVDTPTDDSSVYGWDWSQTTHEGRAGIVNELSDALGPVAIAVPGGGIQGWSESIGCYDAGGYLLGQVFWGGGRDDVHVRATSDAAETARAGVVAVDPHTRTARVDTRVDTLVPFEDLQAIALDAAASYGTQVTTMETLNGPKAGRTIYLGAPSSAIRARIYEKWKESPNQYPDGTNRVEVQLRPPSKSKEKVSFWTREQTFCASRVMTSLAHALGNDAVQAGSLHVRRPTPTLEETLAAMGKQYGKAYARWVEQHAGDSHKVIAYLAGAVELQPVE